MSKQKAVQKRDYSMYKWVRLDIEVYNDLTNIGVKKEEYSDIIARLIKEYKKKEK